MRCQNCHKKSEKKFCSMKCIEEFYKKRMKEIKERFIKK